jgi:type VI secretion system secreted protein VgrG
MTLSTPSRIVLACTLTLSLTACATRGDSPVRHTKDGRICPRAFDFVLADMPGPAGIPLAFSPWMIFRGDAPEGLAMYGPGKVLARGETDAEGRVAMTARQQWRTTQAYCETPDNLWLVYPGQTLRINVVETSDAWSREERLFQFLKAAGYFGNVDAFAPGFFDSERGSAELDMARADYGVENDDALYEAVVPKGAP